MFSSTSFMVSGLSFKSLIHFELILLYKIGVQFHYFAHGCPVFTTASIEDTVFFHILGSFVLNIWSIFA